MTWKDLEQGARALIDIVDRARGEMTLNPGEKKALGALAAKLARFHAYSTVAAIPDMDKTLIRLTSGRADSAETDEARGSTSVHAGKGDAAGR